MKNKRRKDIEDFGKLTTDYLALVRSSCNNISSHKEGAGAYTVIDLKTGEIVKTMSKAFSHTTCNRADLITAVSALYNVPEGKSVALVTANEITYQACYDMSPHRANQDLLEMFKKAAKNKSVKMLHVFNSKCLKNEMWRELAQKAYQTEADYRIAHNIPFVDARKYWMRAKAKKQLERTLWQNS